jgi:hypothetical protein
LLSNATHYLQNITASHFQIRILSGERPIDTSSLVVVLSLPSIDFMGKRGTVEQSPIKTLPIKDADFDFRNVQLTGMVWCVVKDDSQADLATIPGKVDMTRRTSKKHLQSLCFRSRSIKRLTHALCLSSKRYDWSTPSSAFPYTQV